MASRAAFGNTPFLQLPAFGVHHLSQYLLFALLGVLAGAVGVGFTRILYKIEDACDFIWRGPEWARPAVGGLLLRGLLLVLPQMYGVGYPVLENAVNGKYVIAFLLLLLVGKIVATSLTIGIGGSGGVFAPSLFMGAMLGAAFGAIAQHLDPGAAGPVGAYGLIGMGAVFAGAARAPITAVIILFELTGEYTIILPLMTAIVLGTLVSRALSHDTIYSLKLRRRGIDLDQKPQAAAMAGLTAEAAMEPLPTALEETTPLAKAADALAAAPHGALPVTTEDGAYLGIRHRAPSRRDARRRGTRGQRHRRHLPPPRADHRRDRTGRRPRPAGPRRRHGPAGPGRHPHPSDRLAHPSVRPHRPAPHHPPRDTTAS